MSYNIQIPIINEDGSTAVSTTQPQTPLFQEFLLHEDVDDDGTVKGRFLTHEVYVKFITNYATKQELDAAPDDLFGVRFNRHVLQLLLALPKCESLTFVKARRVKGDKTTDTITVVAVDEKGNPLGWPELSTNQVDPTKFASVEWGKGIKNREARGFFKDAIMEEIDLDKVFRQL